MPALSLLWFSSRLGRGSPVAGTGLRDLSRQVTSLAEPQLPHDYMGQLPSGVQPTALGPSTASHTRPLSLGVHHLALPTAPSRGPLTHSSALLLPPCEAPLDSTTTLPSRPTGPWGSPSPAQHIPPSPQTWSPLFTEGLCSQHWLWRGSLFFFFGSGPLQPCFLSHSTDLFGAQTRARHHSRCTRQSCE